MDDDDDDDKVSTVNDDRVAVCSFHFPPYRNTSMTSHPLDHRFVAEVILSTCMRIGQADWHGR